METCAYRIAKIREKPLQKLFMFCELGWVNQLAMTEAYLGTDQSMIELFFGK